MASASSTPSPPILSDVQRGAEEDAEQLNKKELLNKVEQSAEKAEQGGKEEQQRAEEADEEAEEEVKQDWEGALEGEFNNVWIVDVA